ncbi:MAG: metallophosphoesterase [Deltaproteobacteria bacterium]|nr:MAG: metallophosphoesterase [Deltaproteobacteria bacterium]
MASSETCSTGDHDGHRASPPQSRWHHRRAAAVRPAAGDARRHRHGCPDLGGARARRAARDVDDRRFSFARELPLSRPGRGSRQDGRAARRRFRAVGRTRSRLPGHHRAGPHTRRIRSALDPAQAPRGPAPVTNKDITDYVCPVCRKNRITTGSRTGICGKCYQRLRKEIGGRPTKDRIRRYLDEKALTPFRHAAEVLKEIADSARYWDKPPKVVASDCVVVSDLHIPKHDAELLSRMCRVARRDGLRTLIIAGDLIDFGSISRHRAGLSSMQAVENLANSIRALEALAATFETIHVIKGNHDDRLQRLIERAVQERGRPAAVLAELEIEDLEALAYRERYLAVLERWTRKIAPEIKRKVRWYAIPKIAVAGPKGFAPYLVVHPAIYSRHAPMAEKRLWARYTQPIIGTHGHLWGMSVSPSGEHPVVQIGCATIPEKHYYLSERITDHPRWVRGFATIRRGVLRCYVDLPYLVDWDEELSDERAEAR